MKPKQQQNLVSQDDEEMVSYVDYYLLDPKPKKPPYIQPVLASQSPVKGRVSADIKGNSPF